MDDFKYLNRIPSLAKEEIISQEFFDELFSLDEFERNRYKIDIKDRLKAVGLTIGDFDQLFIARENKQKALLKALRSGFVQDIESKLIHFGQDEDLLCGTWDTSMDGIYINSGMRVPLVLPGC